MEITIIIFIVLSVSLFVYMAYILSPWQLGLMDDKELDLLAKKESNHE